MTLKDDPWVQPERPDPWGPQRQRVSALDAIANMAKTLDMNAPHRLEWILYSQVEENAAEVARLIREDGLPAKVIPAPGKYSWAIVTAMDAVVPDVRLIEEMDGRLSEIASVCRAFYDSWLINDFNGNWWPLS